MPKNTLFLVLLTAQKKGANIKMNIMYEFITGEKLEIEVNEDIACLLYTSDAADD